MSSNLTLEIPRRALQLAADKLPKGVTVLLVEPKDIQPEFVRLPDGDKESRCPVTGMSRTWVIERIQASQGTDHPIQAHHIREKGQLRGTVLIDRESYIANIRAYPAPAWAVATVPAEEGGAE